MFFTLTYEFHFRSIIKGYPTGQWVFRSNGFMTQIETKYFIRRMRYDPADQQRRWHKFLLGQHLLIPSVPINEGARATLHVHSSDVNGKSGGTTCHDRERISQFLELRSEEHTSELQSRE